MWTTSIFYRSLANSQLVPQPPTSQKFLDQLVDLVVESQEDYECSICLKKMESGETLNQLPCQHKFHKDCVQLWLKKINSCPLCRHELPPEDVNLRPRPPEPVNTAANRQGGGEPVNPPFNNGARLRGHVSSMTIHAANFGNPLFR